MAEIIRIESLKRDPDRIKSYLKIIKTSTVTTQPLRMIFPTRYEEIGLAKIDMVCDVFNVTAILDNEDNYAVVIAPVIGKYLPSRVGYVMVEDEQYTCLYFEEGDTILPNNTMVASDDCIYPMFQEFYIKGKLPWYLNYEDVSNIMLETAKYADSRTGNNPLTIEILTSIMARAKENKQIYYKSTVTKRDDIFKKSPSYIGVSDIRYSYDTTSSKIIGGYFKEGVINAIVAPETETSKVADLLRS